MKNIFIEGIQGSGKSTLVNNISKYETSLQICREGDYSPIDLAWCALMCKQEYDVALEKYKSLQDEIIKNTVVEQEQYVVTYTKIITDIPRFHKDMENYEVYNGRKAWPELKEIILTRFRNFTRAGYLFECSFFQNIMEDLILFHMLGDEEIVEFYEKLFELVDKQKFMLLYLQNDNLEENIEIIKKERSDNAGNELWYEMMLDYMASSPYGKKYGFSTFQDLVNHLKHRQELELYIIKKVIGENAIVLPAKEYDMEQIESLIYEATTSAKERGMDEIGASKENNWVIRQIKSEEFYLLDDFLYEAIFIPEGVEAPPREIINTPELQVYVKDFGAGECDICFVAEVEEKIVGAVWVRIMDDYGHVEEGVPSFAISLYKEYRGLGIGTSMMKQMLLELKQRGYNKASLAVQKANYAVKMYKKVGFEVVDENEEEYIMICRL